jgi:regulator of extracellular matrix RemA (YlzA/DUF370 family)
LNGGPPLFIHIGNGNVIREKDVIALVDYQLISSSVIMEQMISEARKQDKMVGCDEEVKSVMITSDIVYYSPLSVSALKKRAGTKSIVAKLDDYSDEIDL